MEETFEIERTIKTTFIGDASNDVISKLLELSLTPYKQNDLNETISFYGLRFPDAKEVLVCIWKVPTVIRYQMLAESYLSPTMCDLAVVCYRAGDSRSIKQAKTIVQSLEPFNERNVILLEVCRMISTFSAEGIADGMMKYTIGLNRIDDLTQILLATLPKGDNDFDDVDFNDVDFDGDGDDVSMFHHYPIEENCLFM